MKKILITALCCIGSFYSFGQCDEEIKLDVISGGTTTISGTGSAAIPMNINILGTLAPMGSSCNFTYKINVKGVLSGTTVYTDTRAVSIGSYTYGGNTDPCYANCLCDIYRWTGGPMPGMPFLMSFTVPNQACGSYYVQAEISNVTYTTPQPGGPKNIKAYNVGGGITTASLNSGTFTRNLGNIHLLNFAGTGGLAATASVTNPTCGLTNGSITINPTGGTPSYSYTWYGTTATGATATSLGAGTYTTTVTDAAGCARALTTTLTPTVLVTISPGSQTVCKDKCLTLTASVLPGGVYTYTWQRSVNGGAWTNIGTGASICVRPSSTSSSATTSNAYRVNVINTAGCTGTSSVVITVNPNCTVNWENGCCGQGGGGSGSSSNGGQVAPDQVNEEVILNVLPNPAITEAKIRFNVPADNGRIEIYAMNGQLVQRVDGLSGSGEIVLQLDQFAAGTYNVILYNGDVQTLNEKLIIQK